MPRSPVFPCGCKTTYRAYASDEVIELIKDGSTPTGLAAINTIVKTYPTAEDNNTNIAGQFALHKYPTKIFQPVALKDGSAKEFENVMFKVKNVWGTKAPSNVTEWSNNFKNDTPIPSSDSVEEYITANPKRFHIPLFEELFEKIPNDAELSSSSADFQQNNSVEYLKNKLPVAEAQPLVIWKKSGNRVKAGLDSRKLVENHANNANQPNLENAIKQHCGVQTRKPANKTKINADAETVGNSVKKQRSSTNKANSTNINNNVKSSQVTVVNKRIVKSVKKIRQKTYHSDDDDDDDISVVIFIILYFSYL